jgi:glyoxylase-like metal-dependent hydrolase (beta-lactamase superfamily II)
MTSVNDMADRRARVLADGEALSLGRGTVRWLDTPHVPHAWECGLLFEDRTRTLLCSDLFTQGGAEHPAVTEMDYYAHAANTRPILERLAALAPTTLACMHGSAWRGDGARLLRALADALEQKPTR